MRITIKQYSTKAAIPKDVYKQLQQLILWKGSAMDFFLDPPSWWTKRTINPRIYVAFDKGIAIGWTCHLNKYFNIFVKKKYRKQGIAIKLTKRVVRDKKHHYYVHKKASANLLKKCGITSKIKYI